MNERFADLSDRALNILIKELEKRGFKLDNAAREVYRENVIKVLHEDRHLFEVYSEMPTKLKADIRIFVSNMMVSRERIKVRTQSIDMKQLELAFAKCGPHRLRC